MTITSGVRAAAPPLPRSPVQLNSTELTIRPGRITYTGDATGILGGHQIRGRSAIHWSSWSASGAFGTGFDLENNCEPSCAGGRYVAYPVSLEMWRPRSVAGSLVFTRLTLSFPGPAPPGTPNDGTNELLPYYTFTDVHAHGEFGWGPPSAQGYCVNRHGLAPAAGCANIRDAPPDSLS